MKPLEAMRVVAEGFVPATSAIAKPNIDRLFEEHADFVRRAVINLAGPGMDADDLVQDVFVQVFRGWDRFEGRSSVRTWLYGVALGVVRNARRRARFRRFLGLDAAEAAEPFEPEAQPDAQLERREAKQVVHAVLEKLPEKKRTVLVLFELEGLSGEEIAEVVGCPVQTVWTRLFRARQEFARQLERHEQLERSRDPLSGRKP
jgi:RNA polymerase sigma-70 factor (ECF subfamily)